MARIVVLDSGPLGDACRKRGNPFVERFVNWRIEARANGVIIAIPEIADYEVRRELLFGGATAGIGRLDALRKELDFIPIRSEAMEKAAELWASARRRGEPTADPKELDADVILAAQALLFVGHGDRLTIATYNATHLSRYVDDARDWRAITP